MNRDMANWLKVPCDKNTAWVKLKTVVELLCECIDKNQIQERQLETFRDSLMGSLMVEHDKGNPIHLFKGLVNSQGKVEYAVLRKAMDLAGISEHVMSDTIKRITVYPNGAFAIEYEGQDTPVWR